MCLGDDDDSCRACSSDIRRGIVIDDTIKEEPERLLSNSNESKHCASDIRAVKPKHPRTAYTYFSLYEQNRVRRGIDHLPITTENIENSLGLLPERMEQHNIVDSGGTCHRYNDCNHHHRRDQLSFVDLVGQISSKWKGLALDVRQIFLDLANQDLFRYNNEWKDWCALNKQHEARLS
jgi:hypothetical protein